jgi:hypothetical protein
VTRRDAVRALLGAVLLAACGGSRDPVQGLLDELRDAAEARDAGRFTARLGDGFEGAGGMHKAEAEAMLRRYFAAYESVDLEVYGIETERTGSSARVRYVVEFSGEASKAFGLRGFLPPSAAYRFELEVTDEGGTWKVRRASWRRASAGQGPAT